MSGKKYVGLFFLCFCMSFVWSRASVAEECTIEDAKQIERTIAASTTWDTLYESFRKFKQCTGEVGWLAERYSDTVAKLLATDWKHFPRLATLAKEDASFRQFVLHHIDDTGDIIELDAALKNAIRDCPSNAKTLCKAIETRVEEIVGEIRNSDSIAGMNPSEPRPNSANKE